MIYILTLLIVATIGFLTIKLIVKDKIQGELSLLLGTALGFGLVGQLIFYLQLLGNQFNSYIIPLSSLGILGLLFWLNRKIRWSSLSKNFQAPLCFFILAALAIPLMIEANQYPLGGWDAWSCWNLKAKFIYLGNEHWKNMFDPSLWRSNTGYPLGLPTINAWFWNWSGYSQSIPMFNAIVLTLLTAGILLFGLISFNVPVIASIFITLSLFTLPLGNTLYISQYSDILFSLYLLCVFVCFLHYDKSKNQSFLVLTALFIGLLAFTKNEGLASFVLLSILILLQKPKKPLKFLTIVFFCALPMVIFTLMMAPHSQVFTNGLLSKDQPTTFDRFLTILQNTGKEFLDLKWMGLWILAGIGLIFSKEKAFKSPLGVIGLFMITYLLIILGYYQINTFFTDINWWMNMSLNRIIFALLPSMFLWVGISLFGLNEKKKS